MVKLENQNDEHDEDGMMQMMIKVACNNNWHPMRDFMQKESEVNLVTFVKAGRMLQTEKGEHFCNV